MLFAHFAASGSDALDLPGWALAYVVFAVSVVVVLISRQRHVVSTRPRPGPATAADQSEPSRTVRGMQVVSTVVFFVLVGFCWFGPESLSQNIGPLALVGVLWSLGGWVAAIAGWCWEALDPFAVFARGVQTRRIPTPAWAPLPILTCFVIVWVAWIAGDEPRHLAVFTTLYAAAMITVARLGGTCALRAWNALPCALDLTATITRPAQARQRHRDVTVRRRVGLVAAALLGALGANRVTTTDWFTTGPGTDGDLTSTLAAMAIFATLTVLIGLVWRGAEHLVEKARAERGTRPFAALLGPIAGGVLAAQALPIGLVQAQNFMVLASDPFAQGWNVFGTVYWQVDPDPISPLARGLIQAGAILAGHIAALWAIGHAATESGEGGGASSVRARHRGWTAGLAAMGVTTVSGVVWTLVILG